MCVCVRACVCVHMCPVYIVCMNFDTTACYATAIKLRSKDPQPHVSLATILEETFYLEDLYGFKKEVRTKNNGKNNIIRL